MIPVPMDPSSAKELFGVVLDLMRGALKGAQREDLLKLLTIEGLAEATSAKVKAFLNRNSHPDGTIGDISRADMKGLAEESPEAIGILLAMGSPVNATATAERQWTLDFYARVLNFVCSVALERETSLALRGFLHRDDCISYWDRQFSGGGKDVFSRDGDRVRNNASVEVYLIEQEPTPEELEKLNREIRRNPKRRLPDNHFDYRKNRSVARVMEIREAEVETDQLTPAGKAIAPNPFGFDESPERYISRIEDGAPALASLIGSLAALLLQLGESRGKFERTIAEITSLMQEIRSAT